MSVANAIISYGDFAGVGQPFARLPATAYAVARKQCLARGQVTPFRDRQPVTPHEGAPGFNDSQVVNAIANPVTSD